MEKIELKEVLPAAFAAGGPAVLRSEIWRREVTFRRGEFCLVEVSNSSDVETVKSILQSRVDYMAESGAWYPGPTELWTNSSRVVSNGNYVMMVVHENCDDIVDAFNEYCS